jgi:hypothetical protein
MGDVLMRDALMRDALMWCGWPAKDRATGMMDR